MSTATVAAPRFSGPRRTWSRWWATDPEQARPTSALTVRWVLLDAAEGVTLDSVRVRAGREPGLWADRATVRPSSDGSLEVELRLPVKVWAAPAVLDFTVTVTSAGGGTYALRTAEPFFWNGTEAAVDVALRATVQEDGTVEPEVADVLVDFFAAAS